MAELNPSARVKALEPVAGFEVAKG